MCICISHISIFKKKASDWEFKNRSRFHCPRISVTELPAPCPEPPTRAPASPCPGKTDCVRTCDIPTPRNSKCVHDFREINTFPLFQTFPLLKTIKFLKIIIYRYILFYLPCKYNSLFTTPSNFFPMVDVDKYPPYPSSFFFLHFLS